MVNIGIIGFGKMGKIRAHAIEASEKGVVVSVFDQNDLIDFGDYYRAMNVDEIFNNPEINAVFICTPNCFNKPFTIEGLNAGKHVFCEKPPAFNASDVKEIRFIEKLAKKKLMYGFNHRHHESVKQIKSLIEKGDYGQVLWMRGRYGKSVGQHFLKDWRSKKELAGGGILMDQGIHMLDLFLYLAGDFDEVQAYVSKLYWNLDIEDNVFANIRSSKTGIVASLHSTMTQWRHLFSLEVFLKNGYIVLNGLKTSTETYGDETLTIARNRTNAPMAKWEDEEHITFHENTSWRSEIEIFIDAIVEDQPIRIGNSSDALKLMLLVDKIYEDIR